MTATDSISSLVHYVQLAERLRSSIVAARYVVSLLGDVQAHDPTLGPELSAAMDGLLETVEALVRAEEFARTRLEVMLDEG